MLDNVQQKTIKTPLSSPAAEGTRFYTDEYDIYARFAAWGYEHHSSGHIAAE